MFSSASRQDEADDDKGGPIQSAMNNPLVLRQIFINLTTAELISSCSLVNKLWNFEARTFVRNHRNDCQANLSCVSSPSTCAPCVRLREFVDTLTNMTTVPFSSISVVHNWENLHDNDMECRDYSHSAPVLETVVSKIQLKKLIIELSGQTRPLCATIQYFAFLLLRENSHQLETLEVNRGIPGILNQLVKSWAGDFSRLERIAFGMSGPDLFFGEDFCRKVVQGASNLKALSPHTYCLFDALEMFPEEKHYRMLDRFDLQIRNEFRQRDECIKAGAVGPALAELHVHNCVPWFKPELIIAFKQLLDSSRLSLKALRISLLEDHNSAAEFFTSVEWPTLINVKYFYLVTRGRPEEWDRIIAGLIDFTRIFPALECVTLHHLNDVDDPQDDQQLQDQLDPEISNVCSSVTKLELELVFAEHQGSLAQLETIFPSVRALKLSKLSPSNLPPLDQLFNLWPQLELLILDGFRGYGDDGWPNADAEFCGISREEVETLWGKDEEFLSKLQIVPIRPGISTLKNLKCFKTYFSISKWEIDSQPHVLDPRHQFLSHVTKCLVLGKSPQLEIIQVTANGLPKDIFDPCDGPRAR